MKVEELKALNKNERTFSISFDDNESVEIVGLLKNRVNLIVRKEWGMKMIQYGFGYNQEFKIWEIYSLKLCDCGSHYCKSLLFASSSEESIIEYMKTIIKK